MQYNELTKVFLAKNIYEDTFLLPNLKGSLRVKDTIKNNKLLGRSYEADYIIPTVKEIVTVTKHPIPKRELYVGGGLSASLTNLGIAQAGILYKDRRDKIFGAFVAVVPNGRISYGVQSYWKISSNK